MNMSAPPEISTDLHGHTFFSDARVSPEELVAQRARAKIKVMALTDHDVLTGVPRAAAAARKEGVALIPGMETTSTIHFGTPDVEQIHILAYFPPRMLDDGSIWQTRLAQRAQLLLTRWRAYVLGFLARQPREVRDALDPGGALGDLAPIDFPGLQSVINLIVERHRPSYEHFQLDHVHFWDDAELFGWSPEELIDVIRADGAHDVVAHPVRVRDKARMDRVLEKAWGIEAYTSRHRQDIAEGFRARAERMGKHWTASSDDHQHVAWLKPGRGTPAHTVAALLEGPRAKRTTAA